MKKYRLGPLPGRKKRRGRTIKGKKRDCISFKARVPELVIDVFYAATDMKTGRDVVLEIELKVVGPKGKQGELVTTDEDIGKKGGLATVVFQKAPHGTYTVVYGYDPKQEETPSPETGGYPNREFLQGSNAFERRNGLDEIPSISLRSHVPDDVFNWPNRLFVSRNGKKIFDQKSNLKNLDPEDRRFVTVNFTIS